MGTYQKKSTETCVLKPILIGKKKKNLIWGHFLVERVIFDFLTSKIDDFNVKTRIYREKGNFSPRFERLNGIL